MDIWKGYTLNESVDQQKRKKKAFPQRKWKKLSISAEAVNGRKKNHSWEFIVAYLSFTQIWGSNLYLLCDPETPDQKFIYSRLGTLGHLTKQVQCWPGLTGFPERKTI